MKKCLFCFLSLFLLTIISCSNNENTLVTYVDEDTLKINIQEKGENIIWTKELEGDVLTENIKKNSQVLNNNLSPTVMNVISNQWESIYPYFENFGNLDTRNLNVDVKTFLNSFCQSLSDNPYNISSNFIENNFMFSYVFFLEELSSEWKNYFKEDFPFVKKSAAAVPENNQEDKTEVSKSNDYLFTNWIFGEPFNGEEYIQIPVRFYAKNGSVDAVICIFNNSELKIFNIEIKNWEANNGK